MNEQQKKIIETVFILYEQKGSRFTMDDVAKDMKISKKTIYKDYGNKEMLINLVVEAILESIEKETKKIVNNKNYNDLEKLIKLTCAFPNMKDIDYNKASFIKDDFPKAYEMFVNSIDDNWEMCQKIFEQCILKNYIKDMEFEIFKTIILGISHQVLKMDSLNKEEILNKCIKNVFSGLIVDRR